MHEQSLRHIVEIYNNFDKSYDKNDYMVAYKHLIDNEFMKASPYPLIFLEAPVILQDEDKETLEEIKTSAKTDEERLKEVKCKCGGKCRNAGTITEEITLNLELDGICIQEWDPKLLTLRIEEYTSVRMTAKDNVVFMASYSTRAHTVYEAATNIGRTVFVCLVLSMASIYFTKDA